MNEMVECLKSEFFEFGEESKEMNKKMIEMNQKRKMKLEDNFKVIDGELVG